MNWLNKITKKWTLTHTLITFLVLAVIYLLALRETREGYSGPSHLQGGETEYEDTPGGRKYRPPKKPRRPPQVLRKDLPPPPPPPTEPGEPPRRRLQPKIRFFRPDYIIIYETEYEFTAEQRAAIEAYLKAQGASKTVTWYVRDKPGGGITITSDK